MDYIIYGERNSGTNYLQKLIEINYNSLNYYNKKDNIEIHNNLWKHCLPNYSENFYNTDIVIFVIRRDIYSWLLSMYKKPYHLEINYSNFKDFVLNKNISNYVFNINNVHYYTEYNDIIELYQEKYNYYENILNKKFKNIIYINYEDLLMSNARILKNKLIELDIHCDTFKNYYENAVSHIINDNDNFKNKYKNLINKNYLLEYNNDLLLEIQNRLTLSNIF